MLSRHPASWLQQLCVLRQMGWLHEENSVCQTWERERTYVAVCMDSYLEMLVFFQSSRTRPTKGSSFTNTARQIVWPLHVVGTEKVKTVGDVVSFIGHVWDLMFGAQSRHRTQFSPSSEVAIQKEKWYGSCKYNCTVTCMPQKKRKADVRKETTTWKWKLGSGHVRLVMAAGFGSVNEQDIIIHPQMTEVPVVRKMSPLEIMNIDQISQQSGPCSICQ